VSDLIIILFEIGFIAGIISACSYFLLWLSKEKAWNPQIGMIAIIICVWIIMTIIIKNIFYYSYIAISPSAFSPLRPFFSLMFLIIDVITTFSILFLGTKLKFWDNLSFGVILLILRRILEVSSYYLMMVIFDTQIVGGFYIFIYI
jgi:hypothetical protein